MMELKRLEGREDARFEPMWELYESSFPVFERRTLSDQLAALSDAAYHFDVIMDGAQPRGMLLYWAGPGFYYVEHLAVSAEHRGGGCGSYALRRLMSEGVPVILEIDPPVDDVSIARRHFYERLGLSAQDIDHVHLPYRPNTAGHHLVIMSSSDMNEGDYERFIEFMKSRVMVYASA